MRDHLSELAMLGIVSVTERNEGRRGGTYREYALDMDVELILSAMADTVELVGVHDSIDPYVEGGDEPTTLEDFGDA
jgi:cell division control protein 6